MQLSDYQYLILDEVVELVNPLSDLTTYLQEDKRIWDNGMRLINTIPPLDLSVSKLAEIIFSLFEGGYISVIDDTGCNYLKTDFIPSYEAVLASLCGTGDLNPYGLTDLGGKLWEQYSNPNWDYFTRGGLYYADNPHTCFARIPCTSRETLEQHLLAAQIIPSYEVWSEHSHQHPLIPGTVTWKTLEQWHATYWKTFDHGFEVEFQVILDPELQYVEGKVMTEEEVAIYLFPEYIQNNWYKKYFDIANPSR